jgi:hypothetical protein
MQNQQPDSLGFAIGKLLDAKLCDLMGKPDGRVRFAAHLASGVVSPQIRSAQRQLEDVLSAAIPGNRAAVEHRPARNNYRQRDSGNARGGANSFHRRQSLFSITLQEDQTR